MQSGMGGMQPGGGMGVGAPVGGMQPGIMQPGAASAAGGMGGGGGAPFGVGGMDPFLTGVAGNMLRQQGQSYLQRGQAFVQARDHRCWPPAQLPGLRSAWGAPGVRTAGLCCHPTMFAGRLSRHCWCRLGCHPGCQSTKPSPHLPCSQRWASCRAAACTTTSASRQSMVRSRLVIAC